MYKLHDGTGTGGACVHAALEEIGAPFERIEVDTDKGEHLSDWYTKINLRQQVPSLVLADGSVMTETAAILLHLAEAHPAANLAPTPGTPEHAQTLRWMVFAAANIYEGELRRNYSGRYIDGVDGADRVVTAATGFVRVNYEILEEAASGGPFFTGETLGILDIYLWMLVNWWDDHDWMRSHTPKILGIAKTVMTRPKIAPVHRFHFGDGLGFK